MGSEKKSPPVGGVFLLGYVLIDRFLIVFANFKSASLPFRSIL